MSWRGSFRAVSEKESETSTLPVKDPCFFSPVNVRVRGELHFSTRQELHPMFEQWNRRILPLAAHPKLEAGTVLLLQDSLFHLTIPLGD